MYVIIYDLTTKLNDSDCDALIQRINNMSRKDYLFEAEIQREEEDDFPLRLVITLRFPNGKVSNDGYYLFRLGAAIGNIEGELVAFHKLNLN